MKTFGSVCDLIGQTPLVRLEGLSQTLGATVLGKLESYNPGSSVKDRIALAMIEDAEQQGRLHPGGLIVEPTSGNTGVGLAMVAARRGYRCILVMPDSASVERRMLFEAFGAKVELTPGRLGMTGAINRAKALEDEMGAVSLHQFDNPANPMVHYRTTGPEIWRDTDGTVTALVAGIGTGGTISGTARYLKERNRDIKVIGVEPAESAVLSGGQPGSHKIQGIGAGFVPEILERSLIDEVIPVPSDGAFKAARDLARTEGLLVGISSGAALVGAAQWLQHQDRPQVVVVILPDSGERYLSTALYREDAHV
ncbi:cysteine synthase A [Sulfobacillus sp. hq2]|uniref:cysteine synthase A n=1 Tax=Sulfobacillus TaxID=28033 RepID=UPI000CD1491F|nr:cysteine synthase A [Sulfobacillus sp. hq2]POB10693.1 cysteine synthase A [Sulfobacillus sp. hq2]